jgi:hypothetical protein
MNTQETTGNGSIQPKACVMGATEPGECGNVDESRIDSHFDAFDMVRVLTVLTHNAARLTVEMMSTLADNEGSKSLESILKAVEATESVAEEASERFGDAFRQRYNPTYFAKRGNVWPDIQAAREQDLKDWANETEAEKAARKARFNTPDMKAILLIQRVEELAVIARNAASLAVGEIYDAKADPTMTNHPGVDSLWFDDIYEGLERAQELADRAYKRVGEAWTAEGKRQRGES